MFYFCSNITSIDLNNFDTSDVTIMASMFYCCIHLTSLDVSNFNTNNVTSMNSMFDDCSSLTSLDLNHFDMSNVKMVSNMFRGCTNPNLVIYVADEATKTKIESSSGFPSTATVVIGKPN